MSWIVDRIKKWLVDAINKTARAAILTVATTAIFSLWSYAKGLPAPHIFVGALVTFTALVLLATKRREILSKRTEDKTTKLTAELETVTKKLEQQSRLADVKSVLKDQIQSAPRAFELESAAAWLEATDRLLCEIKLPITGSVHEVFDSARNKTELELAISHVRALIANLKESDMPVAEG